MHGLITVVYCLASTYMHTEHAWDSYLAKDITLGTYVQKCATCWVTSNITSACRLSTYYDGLLLPSVY